MKIAYVSMYVNDLDKMKDISSSSTSKPLSTTSMRTSRPAIPTAISNSMKALVFLS